jgi:hypothetical protein
VKSSKNFTVATASQRASLQATWVLPNTVIVQSLGRLPARDWDDDVNLVSA